MPHQEGEHRPSHDEISIETLSTPPTHLNPAPLIRRTVAAVVDSMIVGIPWIVLTVVIRGVAGFWTTMSSAYAAAESLSYLFAATFAYYLLLEWIFASTVGKSVMKLRVVGKDGEPCSLSASFKRNLVRAIDWLPFAYVVGAIAIVASKNRQRIGDIVAATVVTVAPEKDINPPPAPFLFH